MQLPRARVNKKTEYVFGSSIDVRKPDAKTTGTLAVYSTRFEDELFTDLLREGAFIEDVVFWVSEAPDCPSSVPREVEAEHFHSEDRAERRELGGRAWQLNTKLWRLRDTNVNKVTYSYAAPVAETGTCVRLNAGYSERMAPRGPEDRSKYVRFDPSEKAQAANARMRERVAHIAEDAARTFRIE